MSFALQTYQNSLLNQQLKLPCLEGHMAQFKLKYIHQHPSHYKYTIISPSWNHDSDFYSSNNCNKMLWIKNDIAPPRVILLSPQSQHIPVCLRVSCLVPDSNSLMVYKLLQKLNTPLTIALWEAPIGSCVLKSTKI